MAISNSKDINEIALGGELFDKAYAKEKYYVKNNPEIMTSFSNSYDVDFSSSNDHSGFSLPDEPRDKFVIGEFINKGIKYLAVTSFKQLDSNAHTEMYVVKKSDCILAKWGGKLTHLFTIIKQFIAPKKAVIAW